MSRYSRLVQDGDLPQVGFVTVLKFLFCLAIQIALTWFINFCGRYSPHCHVVDIWWILCPPKSSMEDLASILGDHDWWNCSDGGIPDPNLLARILRFPTVSLPPLLIE